MWRLSLSPERHAGKAISLKLYVASGGKERNALAHLSWHRDISFGARIACAYRQARRLLNVKYKLALCIINQR